jgi:hypothetical protein
MTDYINFDTHPRYKERLESWETARDLYRGEHKTLVQVKYLWPHRIETLDGNEQIVKQSSEIRRSREQRTRFKNNTEMSVSMLQSLFFKSDPESDEQVKELFGGDYVGIDEEGNKITMPTFIKSHVFTDLALYGKPIILADAPPGEFRSAADVQVAKHLPRLRSLCPLAVKDWDIETLNPDRLGQYNALRHEYYYIAPRERLTSKVSVSLRSDELCLVNGKYVINVYEMLVDKDGKPDCTDSGEPKWQQIFSVPTKLERVPVSVMSEDPWLEDANQEVLRGFNLRSNMDNIQYNQGYRNVFVIGLDPKDQDQIKAFSENAVNLIPEGGSVTALEPVNVEGYEKSVSQSARDVLALAMNQLHVLPFDSKEAPGEGAQEQQWEPVRDFILSTITRIEAMVNESVQNAALFAGKENFTGKVTFNKQLTKEDWTKWLETYNSMHDLLKRVDGFEEAAAKKAITALNFPDEEKAKLLKNADNLEEAPTMADRQGVLDQFGKGTPDQQADEKKDQNLPPGDKAQAENQDQAKQ